MDIESSNTVKSVGIVGGGKVGHQLFMLFSNSQRCRVEYVVDINPSAPAVLAAKQANVRTYTSLETALDRPVDLILEVTGNATLVETIHQKIAGTSTALFTHDMAFIILSVIGDCNHRIAAEISEVKTEINKSLRGITHLVESIEDITSQMNILSINARIEAARVGEQGKGFAVVASEIGRSADNVKETTRQIEQVNAAIASTSAKIDVSLRRLN